MRKTMFGILSVIATAFVVGGISDRAEADYVLVDFAYTFDDGARLSGTVAGSLSSNGDLVTQLFDLDAVFSGRPGTPLTFLFPTDGIPTLSLSGVGYFSFYGFASDPLAPGPSPDFGFVLSNDSQVTNPVVVGTFLANAGGVGYPGGADLLETTPFRVRSYSATLVPLAVPGPSSFLLCGAGATGLLIASTRRRRPVDFMRPA